MGAGHRLAVLLHDLDPETAGFVRLAVEHYRRRAEAERPQLLPEDQASLDELVAALSRLAARSGQVAARSGQSLDIGTSSTAPSAHRPPGLLTYRHAAELLGISERTLRRHVAGGKVRALRVGRSVRFDPADILGRLTSGAP